MKNLDSIQSGTTLYVQGRSLDKGKSQDRARSKSKSQGILKNIECYNYGKKGHLEKDYWSSKKDKKEKQDKGKKNEDDSSSGVKIEEINAVDGDSEEGEILLNSGLESSQLVTTDDLAVQDWIMDSRASFHVTPHREWFTSYDAKRTG